ncbi:bridge-like lipid transfer protein family member 3B [Branchiostoma lanceolatum]|uniref:bridge-like lipid transfer protein family member 3B n=1 Tax=Branchiostoma lanceolatum TaxID=7740 RepID=UPI003452EAE5
MSMLCFRFTKGLSVDKISLSTLKGEGELANLELDEIVFTKGLSVDKISLSTLKGEGELANLELDEIVFTKGLSVDKISLSTLKGEGELANLELDEIVLQDVLDLPTWVTIKKATCNKVAIKIQWTKLKTHPICLYMDQIDIEMETCDEPRAPNNPSPFMSQGGDTKYGFAEKVVDGMSLTINSVTIRFISHAFTASFQLSRIRARSTTPQWQVADLRMTRIKDTERGMVLTFKEIDWQTLRIEADAVKTEKTNYVSTPVRLITNQSRIRIVIKKQLHDCSVVSSKLHLILDDLLWVLTDSQLKAMASYMQSLSKLIRKSTEQNKRDASSQPSPPSPQHHATQRSHAAAAGTAPRNPQLEAVSKFFSKYDMVETSYHIFTRRLDLHLCDDTNPMEQGKRDVLHWWQVCCPSEQEKFNRRTDGGAMQITFHRLMLDYYPYHFVGMNKKHWFRHSECMDARDQWAELLLSEFKHQLKEWKKATADAAEGQESKDGSQEEVRGQQPGARGHKPRPKLMSSGIVFRLEDFELYQVSTSDTRHSTPKKFFSSDKKALYLPQEMSAVHLEYTEYYFPEGVDHPVPSPNIYGQINAVQLTLDYMTVLWANQFLLNVAQSMAAAPMDRQESVEEPASASLHVDIRLEILMPKISLPAEKPVADQPDRRQMLVAQSLRTVLTLY